MVNLVQYGGTRGTDIGKEQAIKSGIGGVTWAEAENVPTVRVGQSIPDLCYG